VKISSNKGPPAKIRRQSRGKVIERKSMCDSERHGPFKSNHEVKRTALRQIRGML